MIENEFSSQSSWGWLPILVPVSFFGLLLTSLAMTANIYQLSFSMLIFWAGILFITVPVVLRLRDRDVEYREAFALVILAGEVLFLVSVLRSYVQNSPYDGYLHWRTASDILTTHHLFTFNNLLPISPYYPGLELATNGLINLTGLPIFTAGNIVVFVARFIMLASLFILLCMMSGSVRAAGLGSMVYMGSSTFVFFDTQFAYESLSLPLATLVIWLVLRRSQNTSEHRENWTALAILVGGMVTITHHLMSYFLTGILLVWTVVTILKNRRRGEKEYVPRVITLVMLIFVLVWLIFVAEITVGYLAPYIGATLVTLLKFITGYRGDRAVFSAAAPPGQLSERYVAMASVLFLLIGEGLGLWVWWKKSRTNRWLQSGLAFVMVLTSMVYPLLPLLHLNHSTWEVADRLASFIFIGLAFVIGLGLAETRINLSIRHLRFWLVGPMLGLIICAGIIGGSHPAIRLPGTYLVMADSRSADAYGISAAMWALEILGPNNRMAADRTQSVIMGSFGRQSMVFGGVGGANISPVFLKPDLKDSEIRDITVLDLHYLVVDRRITQSAPLFGYYFENWEQQVAPSSVPVDRQVLEKFNDMPDVNCIFDNGNIRIYEIGGLIHVP